VSRLRAPVASDAAAVALLRGRYAPEPVPEVSVQSDWGTPGFDVERDARLEDDGYAAVVSLDDERTWIELHGSEPQQVLAWALERAPAGRLFSGGWEPNEPSSAPSRPRASASSATPSG
jgi:hypothetical protein